jgi:transposase InsO family protein
MSTDAHWVADRTELRRLLRDHPTWTNHDDADALHHSVSWVQKWHKRIEAAPDDDAVFQSQSRARHNPPPTLSQEAEQCVLALREKPPDGLKRVPGPVTILAYLKRYRHLIPEHIRLPASSSTIWRILRKHLCIELPDARTHHPVERPAPMTRWAIDFKQCLDQLAEENDKRQAAVEALNIVDEGTSIVVDSRVRSDFTAETALITLINIFQEHGLPNVLVMDRDPRFVGAPSGSDFPSLLLRVLHNLVIQVLVCPPRRPDKNPFVERFHRSLEYECLRVYRPVSLEQVKEVVKNFRDHYNHERPNQARTCRNLPPCEAFPKLPSLRSLPKTIDPDRWVEVLDGKRFVRKVRANGTVSIDNTYYYVGTAKQGCSLTFRINGAKRTLVVEEADTTLKEIPIKGLIRQEMSLKDYVALILREIHSQRLSGQASNRQLALPLETLDTGATGATTM